LENLFFGRFSQPIIAKGYVYPLAENHGSILKKLVIWIYFVRVCQTESSKPIGLLLSVWQGQETRQSRVRARRARVI
jgi:hypothetical protein